MDQPNAATKFIAGILLLASLILAIDVVYCIATGVDYPTEPYRPYRYFLSVPFVVAAGAALLIVRSANARRWLTLAFVLSALSLLYHAALLLWHLCHRVTPG